MPKPTNFCPTSVLLILTLLSASGCQSPAADCWADVPVFQITGACPEKHTHYDAIDAVAGRLVVEGYPIVYDYNIYNGVNGIITANEYLLSDRWLGDALNVLPLKHGIIIHPDTVIRDMKIISRDTLTREVRFQYKESQYRYTVEIPDQYQHARWYMDRIDGRPAKVIIRETAGRKQSIQVLISGGTAASSTKATLSLTVQELDTDQCKKAIAMLKRVQIKPLPNH